MSSWRSHVRIAGIAGAMVMIVPLSAASTHFAPTAHRHAPGVARRRRRRSVG